MAARTMQGARKQEKARNVANKREHGDSVRGIIAPSCWLFEFSSKATLIVSGFHITFGSSVGVDAVEGCGGGDDDVGGCDGVDASAVAAVPC